MTKPTAQDLIDAERRKAGHQANAATFDETNSVNDFIAIASGYLGRAAQKMPRNEREGCDTKEMLVKAGAVIHAAIESLP